MRCSPMRMESSPVNFRYDIKPPTEERTAATNSVDNSLLQVIGVWLVSSGHELKP